MWIIIATVVGIIFGSVVGPWATNLKFIGDIFINLIQMSVVVLVMTAVAGAIAGLGGNGSGKWAWLYSRALSSLPCCLLSLELA